MFALSVRAGKPITLTILCKYACALQIFTRFTRFVVADVWPDYSSYALY